MYCRNYRLWISWLDHSLKKAVSEHGLTFNMWKRSKYLRNLHESNFILFFHHSEGNWFGKCLLYCQIKSQGFLFTYWLAKANILFRVLRICNSEMKCNSLKKETLFQDSLLHFWNLHHILNILKEKMIVIANVFPKLQNVKIFVRKLSKEHRFRRGFGIQDVKASQMVGKSPWESFYEVFLSISLRLIWKMSHPVSGEILGVLV